MSYKSFLSLDDFAWLDATVHVLMFVMINPNSIICVCYAMLVIYIQERLNK